MLEIRDLKKSFGAINVTNEVSMRLEKGERRVLLGPNGAGKTTLFNLLTGELKPDSGQVLIDGNDVTRASPDVRARMGLGRSFQKNNLFEGLSADDSLRLAVAASRRRLNRFWTDSCASSDITEAVDHLTEQVGLASVRHVPVDSLAYGQRRQLEVGLALATDPKILLLDEPTSGVSPRATGAFHQMVKQLPRELSVLIIEHDMDLAFDVADTVTVLNYGSVVFEGTPDEARGSELVREIYLGDWSDHAEH